MVDEELFYKTFDDVMEDDKKTVESFGIDPKQVSEKMSYVINETFSARKKCLESHGEIPDVFIIDDKYHVSFRQNRSYHDCMFCQHQTNLSEVTITNEEAGKTVAMTGLMPHYIEAHGYYGHPAIRFERVNPKKVVEVLDVKSE